MTTVLIALGLTKALPTRAWPVYSLGFALFGIALMQERRTL